MGKGNETRIIGRAELGWGVLKLIFRLKNTESTETTYNFCILRWTGPDQDQDHRGPIRTGPKWSSPGP